jgi:hypothetical protein
MPRAAGIAGERDWVRGKFSSAARLTESLWTVNPDGTQETAFYANNMVFPEAILDARPVPNSHLIVGTFAKHNSTPRGSIAMVDPRLGKNSLAAIFNFEHPDQVTTDTGDSCEPWPISEDVVLFSGRPKGAQRNVLEMIDRAGQRVTVLVDPEYCLHSPMLVKPRLRPRVVSDIVDRESRTGRFFLQDIYEGLPGIERGSVKWLRVIEETSRISERTDGPNPYNQTFLLSSALAFSVKNVLGVVPVAEDGSAYFELPSGRAVYLQALDEEGRLVQSMRTFVQAAPGTTRSCIGCHEHKQTATKAALDFPSILRQRPSRLEPEKWGSGYIDYASMVQPILNRRCVRCHGGKEGIAAGMDLSGGWTEHFNISYENLTNRAETQLVAYWIAGIDCMNGTALWSAQIFPPRSHGSGAAPLADLLIEGHEGYSSDLTRQERDLLMAWIDTNGLYYGTWNRTASGCAIQQWASLKNSLASEMQQAGCLECHGQKDRLTYFENDWVNLERPELSRILRAPLAAGSDGYGLAWCRDRKVTPDRQRLHLLWNGYAHAVQPVEAFSKHRPVQPDRSGQSVVSFSSTSDHHYQAMLATIREVREAVLTVPRVDMPGATIQPGQCRALVAPHLPDKRLPLNASVDPEGVVTLEWGNASEWIGLEYELHRSDQNSFEPSQQTLLTSTPLLFHVDRDAPQGRQFYCVRPVGLDRSVAPVYTVADVPRPVAPDPPINLRVVPSSGTVQLEWNAPQNRPVGYHVYRAADGSQGFDRITKEPVATSSFVDLETVDRKSYVYFVRSVSCRNVVSEPTEVVTATATIIKEPMFHALLSESLQAILYPSGAVTGEAHGNAQARGRALDLTQGGHITFARNQRFDLSQPLTVSCEVKFDTVGKMPVIVSCGAWGRNGWFLQRLGDHWRWYVGGVVCDGAIFEGGSVLVGNWVRLTGTYDGQKARLYENGKLIAEQTGVFDVSAWPGDLHIGQYSGQPADEYQVTGRIRDVKIYHCAIEDTVEDAGIEQ